MIPRRSSRQPARASPPAPARPSPLALGGDGGRGDSTCRRRQALTAVAERAGGGEQSSHPHPQPHPPQHPTAHRPPPPPAAAAPAARATQTGKGYYFSPPTSLIRILPLWRLMLGFPLL